MENKDYLLFLINDIFIYCEYVILLKYIVVYFLFFYFFIFFIIYMVEYNHLLIINFDVDSVE